MVGGLSSDQVSVMSRPGQAAGAIIHCCRWPQEEGRGGGGGGIDRLELGLQRMTALLLSFD